MVFVIRVVAAKAARMFSYRVVLGLRANAGAGIVAMRPGGGRE